jgi:Arm DNA-binding domain
MSARGSVYRRSKTWTAHANATYNGKRFQPKKGGFRTEREAQQHLTKMLAQLDMGIVVPPDRLIVEAYLDAWLEHLEHVVGRNRSTIRGYRSNLWSYTIPRSARCVSRR